MKIFVSWSKPRSKVVALALKTWIPTVIPSADVWVSDVDIEKGAMWMNAVTEHLARTDVGIVVLTKENLSERWLNFEAGALSMAPERPRIFTLLVGLEHEEVAGPLALFNGTLATKSDISRLMCDLPSGLVKGPLLDAVEAAWPRLEGVLDEVLAQGSALELPGAYGYLSPVDDQKIAKFVACLGPDLVFREVRVAVEGGVEIEAPAGISQEWVPVIKSALADSHIVSATVLGPENTAFVVYP